MSEEEILKLDELGRQMENIKLEQERLQHRYVELYGHWYPLWSKAQREKENQDA